MNDCPSQSFRMATSPMPEKKSLQEQGNEILYVRILKFAQELMKELTGIHLLNREPVQRNVFSWREGKKREGGCCRLLQHNCPYLPSGFPTLAVELCNRILYLLLSRLASSSYPRRAFLSLLFVASTVHILSKKTIKERIFFKKIIYNLYFITAIHNLSLHRKYQIIITKLICQGKYKLNITRPTLPELVPSITGSCLDPINFRKLRHGKNMIAFCLPFTSCGNRVQFPPPGQ